MADETWLRGIVEVDVFDNDAPRRLQEIRARLQQEAQAFGNINISGDLGQRLGQDLTQGEAAIERFAAALRELRAMEAQQNGTDSAGQARIRQYDVLIAKAEQLRRIEAIPANASQREISTTRAEVLRDNARLRSDVYGGGLEGARRSDAVGEADRRVRGADANITKVQGQLALAMEERLAQESKLRLANAVVEKRELALAEAMRARERNLEEQRTYNATPGYTQREVRPGAAVQLGVEKAERDLVAAREAQVEQARVEAGIDQRIETAKNQLRQAEERRANAANRADLTRERVNGGLDANSEAEAERRRAQASPQRALLLNPDGEQYLAGRGVDTTQSLKMQELLTEQQRLAQAKQSLLTRAATLSAEKDIATTTATRDALEKRILANTAGIERQKFVEGGRGGFFGGFLGTHGGGGGAGPGGPIQGADIGFQAGQALKYYALYTALSGVQQAIGGLIQISAEYTNAVSDLAIAMHVSNDEAAEAAKGYAEIGAALGTGPVEALQGASKFRRTFRDPDTQQSLPGSGEAGARIASYVNILDGPQQIEKTLQDLISVMRAYGQGPEGATRVYDQTQSISQLYGFQSAEVLPGAAALSDLGKASGYSLPELVALIASVMQQTGTTSDAAAGDVKRILGSQDDPELNRTFEKYGVSLDQTFKQRMDQLSLIIDKLPDRERARAITDLSADPRTGAVRAAILSGAQGARDAVSGAQDSTGLVEKQVQQRLDNLGGQLKALSANLYQAAVAFGDLGLTQLLTDLIKLLNAAAGGLKTIAGAVGLLPDPIKEAVVAIGLFLLAMKGVAATRAAFAGNSVLSGIATASGLPVGAGRAATAARSVEALQVQRQLALAAGSTQLAQSYGAQIAAQQAVGTAGTRMVAGLKGVGSFLSTAAVGWAAAITGALLVINKTTQIATNADAAGATAIGASGSIDAGIESGNASQVKEGVAALREQREKLRATGDGFWGVLTDVLSTGEGNESRTASAREAALAAIDKQLKKGLEAQAELDAADAKLADLQGTAAYYGQGGRLTTYRTDQMKLQGISPERATANLNTLITTQPTDRIFPQVEGEKGAADQIKNAIDSINEGTDPLKQQEQLGALAATVRKLAAAAASGTVEQQESARRQIDIANRAYIDSITSNIDARVANIKALQGEGPKARRAITREVSAGLDAATQAGDVGATIKLLDNVNQAFVDNYRKNLEAQRQVLIDQLEAIAKIARATSVEDGADHFTRLGLAPDPTDQNGRKKQVAEIDKQIATLEAAGKQSSFGNSYFDGNKDKAEDIEAARIASLAQPGNAVQQAQINLRLAKYHLKNADKGTVEYYTAVKEVKDAQYSLSQAYLDVAKAQVQAGVRPGDNYSQALAALKIARLDLKNAVGKDQYWAALKELRDAQYELATIELERANNARLLASDVTDPVDQARAAVQAAKDKLAFDKARGASAPVITADKLALKQAQATAADTAWQQQFGDMQTNYDLNRISLSAYLKYLNSQKAYLEAVKNKTRDQVEQLNQVDQALKGLAEGLQGQWNLGDIQMPTAYEMRRAVAAGGAGSVQNNITINGADFGKVMAFLQTYLGASVIQSAPSVPAKV